MDSERFDRLAKTLVASGTRRTLLFLFTALPPGVTLNAILRDGPDVAAQDDDHGSSHRRHRRKARNRHHPGQHHTDTHKGKGKDKKGSGPGPSPTCTGLKPTDDLQAAIDAALDGATLILCAGTWKLTSTVRITKNLNLIGGGDGQAILDGGKPSTGPGGVRVLEIAAGATATVQDLEISGGQVTGTVHGGGILNEGALTLRGVTVTGNASASAGGGISNDGSLILGANSFVTFNTAVDGGGGIVNFGTVTLQANSHVERNTHTGAVGLTAAGGGILNFGTLTLEPNSSVSNNTATSLGGGIKVNSGQVTLQKGSRVTGNQAPNGGGGVFQAQGTVIDEDPSIVTDNTPNNCRPVNTIANCVD